MSADRTPDPNIVVLFGATGDLAHRKVVPALYHLWLSKLLPENFALLCFGQNAIAQSNADALAPFYQRKRDLFLELTAGSRFRPLKCEGTYFQCVDYSAISDLDDTAFCRQLIEQVGVAAIPLSAFYAEPPARQLIRFCFAKQDATLDEALIRLQRL